MSQSPPVAVCPGPDFLALLAVLGAEFGGFALPLGLHALIDGVRVGYHSPPCEHRHWRHSRL